MSQTLDPSTDYLNPSARALMGPNGTRDVLRSTAAGTPLPLYGNVGLPASPPPGSASVFGAPTAPSGVPGAL